jgi:DNA-binding PadR family transcriptional regulator
MFIRFSVPKETTEKLHELERKGLIRIVIKHVDNEPVSQVQLTRKGKNTLESEAKNG